MMVGYCGLIGEKFRYSDEREYLTLAKNLDARAIFSLDGVHPTAFRPPGYPVALAVVHWLGSPWWAVRQINVVAYLVVIFCVWWLARRVAGNVAATLAAPLAATYPLGFYSAGALYPQQMAAAGLLLGLVGVTGLSTSRRPKCRIIGAGAALSFSIVCVPTFVVPALVIGAWVMWRERRLVLALGFVFVSLVPSALWTIRNGVVLHAFVPISDNNGLNLLLGNSAHTGPRSGVNVDISRFVHHAASHHLNEVQTNNYFAHEALVWISQHPVDAAVLYVQKTLNYFAPFDHLATAGQGGGGVLVLSVSYAALLAGLVLWFVTRRGRRDALDLLVFLYLVGAPVQAIYFTRVRFREPLDYLLIVVGCCALARALAGSRTLRGAEASTPEAR